MLDRQVDCARIGGITPWLKVAHLAETFNVAVCPHFLMELHVSLTARRAERRVGRDTFRSSIRLRRRACRCGTAAAIPPRRRVSESTGILRRSSARPSRARRSAVEGKHDADTKLAPRFASHPNDDVVIARGQLVGGTTLIDEKVTIAGLVPPGHKVATRAVAKGQPVSATTRSSASRAATSRPASTFTSHNLVMGDVRSRLRVRRRRRSRRSSSRRRRRSMGIVRDDGRVATRNYIGILSTVNCSATVARGIAEHFRGAALAAFPNVDGVVALTHGSGCGMDTHGEGMQLLRPHARRLRAPRQLRRRAGRRPGLRGEPDRARLFGAEHLRKVRCFARSRSRTRAARPRPLRTVSR